MKINQTIYKFIHATYGEKIRRHIGEYSIISFTLNKEDNSYLIFIQIQSNETKKLYEITDNPEEPSKNTKIDEIPF